MVSKALLLVQRFWTFYENNCNNNKKYMLIIYVPFYYNNKKVFKISNFLYKLQRLRVW